MTEISDFGLIVLLVSAGVFLAVLGMRLADRISVPNAAIFLVAAGILATTVDALGDALSIKVVERIGVIALIVILFDGGLLAVRACSISEAAETLLVEALAPAPDHVRRRVEAGGDLPVRQPLGGVQVHLRPLHLFAGARVGSAEIDPRSRVLAIILLVTNVTKQDLAVQNPRDGSIRWSAARVDVISPRP